MRNWVSKFVAGAFAATMLSPVQASDGFEAEPEIVVEGRKTQRQQIRQYVRTLAPFRMDEQIGRFVDPVCPVVMGLAAHEEKAATERYRQVAKASGVRLAKDPCRANVVVIAVKDKAKFIESIPRYAPAFVDGLPKKRLRALARSPGPASGWQVTGLRDQNGLPLSGFGLNPNNPVAAPSASSVDQSRLNRATQTSFTVSVLVVEKAALANISTRQFADYAAMRTLAPIDPLSYRHRLAGNPQSKLPAPSILTLFDAGRTPLDSPESVTWWDFAFLQALYDMRMNRNAYQQRGEIQARMNKILASLPQDEM